MKLSRRNTNENGSYIEQGGDPPNPIGRSHPQLQFSPCHPCGTRPSVATVSPGEIEQVSIEKSHFQIKERKEERQ